jgi:hypothetical protein
MGNWKFAALVVLIVAAFGADAWFSYMNLQDVRAGLAQVQAKFASGEYMDTFHAATEAKATAVDALNAVADARNIAKDAMATVTKMSEQLTKQAADSAAPAAQLPADAKAKSQAPARK